MPTPIFTTSNTSVIYPASHAAYSVCAPMPQATSDDPLGFDGPWAKAPIVRFSRRRSIAWFRDVHSPGDRAHHSVIYARKAAEVRNISTDALRAFRVERFNRKRRAHEPVPVFAIRVALSAAVKSLSAAELQLPVCFIVDHYVSEEGFVRVSCAFPQWPWDALVLYLEQRSNAMRRKERRLEREVGRVPMVPSDQLAHALERARQEGRSWDALHTPRSIPEAA